MEPSIWKALRYRLEWLGCTAFAALIPMLPHRVCLALARGLGWLAYNLDARGRHVSMANLTCVFPERSEAERRLIALRSYQNFARSTMDLLWSRRLNEQNWRRFIETDADPESLRREVKEHGAAFLCIHWGHFEWASLGVGFMGVSARIVTEAFKNPRLNAFFSKGRAVSGHVTIPRENAMISLLKTVKRKGAAGLLVDLTLRPDQAAVPIMAFGRKMSVTFLESLLVQRGKGHLIPLDGIPLPDGRCKLVVNPSLQFPPDASLQEIAQACWDFFEPRILERPDLYMWAYKHFRYRPKDADPSFYPAYANVSPVFDEMLEAFLEPKPSSTVPR
ncbi:MAG: lysophospholipid acyltransferase family protein [Chthoniobacteraceae bacterium]